MQEKEMVAVIILRRRGLRIERKTFYERSLCGGFLEEKVGLRVGDLVVFSHGALLRRIRKRRGGRRRKGRRGMERRTDTTR